MKTMLLSFKPEWFEKIKKVVKYTSVDVAFLMKKLWHTCMLVLQ